MRSTAQKPVYYAVVLAAYGLGALIPMRSNVAQYLHAWDASLHVVVYLWTYFLTLYVSVATGMEPQPARVICSSMWVLLVNRWWLSTAVPLWVLHLQELAHVFSRRTTTAVPPPCDNARTTPHPQLSAARTTPHPQLSAARTTSHPQLSAARKLFETARDVRPVERQNRV